MSCLAFLAFGYLWGLSALFGFRGAAIFNREEADGTLYRVLATKRGGELLLRRKVKGLWRLFRILFVPYAILVLVQAFTMMHGAGGAGRSLDALAVAVYVLSAIPAFLVALPMFAWFGIWMGVASPTFFCAFWRTFALIAAWMGASWAACVWLDLGPAIFFVSPAAAALIPDLAMFLEDSCGKEGALVLLLCLAVYFVLQIAILEWFHGRCLARLRPVRKAPLPRPRRQTEASPPLPILAASVRPRQSAWTAPEAPEPIPAEPPDPRRAGLPLLAKELSELAARKRTYILRVVYAILLFGGFILFLRGRIVIAAGDAKTMVGTGTAYFEFLAGLQFAGIFLFFPAMAAGALSGERERGSLDLLKLCGLTPSQIVLQKLGGHLVPILSFLVLALPALAVGYSFGGLSPARLASGAYLLVLAAVQTGALAMAASALGRNPSQSLIAVFGMGAAFHLFPPLFFLFFSRFLRRPGVFLVLAAILTLVCIECFGGWCWFPPVLFSESAGGQDGVFFRSLPALLSIPVFLAFARLSIGEATAPISVSREQRLSREEAQIFSFRPYLMFLGSLSKRLRGVPVSEGGALPERRPVTWREIRRLSRGPLRLATLPAYGLAALAFANVAAEWTFGGGGYEAGTLSRFVYILWAVVALQSILVGASLLRSERAEQSLEVLLSTPLRGRDIVLQKMAGVYRLLSFFLLPYGFVLANEMLLEWKGNGPWIGFAAFLMSFLALPIHAGLLLWFSAWAGIRLRPASRAIPAVFAVACIWLGLPWIVAGLTGANRFPWDEWTFQNPFLFLQRVEELPRTLSTTGPWAFGHLCLHVFLLAMFRELCLRAADRRLALTSPKESAA